MRVAVIFFLFLCFSFLGRYNFFYPKASHSRIHIASTLGFLKTTYSELFHSSENQIRKNKIPGKGKDHFLIIEDEEDHVFVRKIVLSTQYFITLSLFFGLISVIKYFKIGLPFCRQVSNSSYKYILQRVLRI